MFVCCAVFEVCGMCGGCVCTAACVCVCGGGPLPFFFQTNAMVSGEVFGTMASMYVNMQVGVFALRGQLSVVCVYIYVHAAVLWSTWC